MTNGITVLITTEDSKKKRLMNSDSDLYDTLINEYEPQIRRSFDKFIDGFGRGLAKHRDLPLSKGFFDLNEELYFYTFYSWVRIYSSWAWVVLSDGERFEGVHIKIEPLWVNLIRV